MGVRGWLLELLFPRKCAFCGKLTGGLEICPTCRDKLPRTTGADCDAGGDFLDACITPLYYEGMVRDSIRRYKFQGASFYASCYGALLADSLQERAGRADVVTWAPVSRKRKRQRGYDQAALLAEEVAGRLGLPCVRLLEKIRHTAENSALSGAEKRRANVSGAYTAADPELTNGKRILLVDDVYTTGATMSECARTLLMAGAASVCGAALARTPRKKTEPGG